MAVKECKMLPSLLRLNFLRPVTRTCARPSRSLASCSSPGPRRQPLGNSYRPLSTGTESQFPKKQPKTVKLTFIDRDGDELIVEGRMGDTLLEVAKEYDIDLEGACEGTLSCSTCHLIVDPEWFDKIPDPITEEEQDMLDMAFELTDTSRLGCQILVSEALEGIKLKVPSVTRDIRNT